MTEEYNKKLILEDGTEFYGSGFAADREAIVEVVFNTSMVGYQEILSDPSYTDQAVVMTYPLIGNYGMCDADYETDRPGIRAMIVREYNREPSNFRSTKTLETVMLENDIVGLSGVDTRALARHIRDRGTCRGLITGCDTPNAVGTARLLTVNLPRDQVARASCKAAWFSPGHNPRFHVAAIDCGMKRNIIRSLNARNCDVTILPWDTAPETVEALRPDGVFISNGPGTRWTQSRLFGLYRRCGGNTPYSASAWAIRS